MGHAQASSLLPASAEEAYAFLADPENVPETLEGFLQVQFPRTPPRLEPGVEIEASVSRFGVAVRAVFRVESAERGRRLSYRQVAGLLRSWEHEISVEPHDETSCRVTESAAFRLPFGVVGSLVDDVFVRAEVEKALKARQAKIAEILRARRRGHAETRADA